MCEKSGHLHSFLSESRTPNSLLSSRTIFLGQFSIQLERLRSSTRESRKRQKMLQTQVRTMLEERSDLLVQMQDQTREINVLRRSLGFAADSEPLDNKKISCTAGSHLSNADLKQLLDERNDMRARIRELEAELKEYRPQSVRATVEHELAEAAALSGADT